jgi:hypothetical protein
MATDDPIRPGDRVIVTEDAAVDLTDTTLHLSAGTPLAVLETRPGGVRVMYGRPVWLPQRLVRADR